MATGFDHLDGDSFNIPFILGGTYIYSPEVQFVFGVGVNFQSRFPVLPGGGIRWKFAPDWTLNADFPTPRLEFEASRNLTLFAGADIKATTFRTDDRFGDTHGDTSLNSAWLSYQEVRTGVGAEWKINPSSPSPSRAATCRIGSSITTAPKCAITTRAAHPTARSCSTARSRAARGTCEEEQPRPGSAHVSVLVSVFHRNELFFPEARQGKSATARHRRQHTRRVRYPDCPPPRHRQSDALQKRHRS